MSIDVRILPAIDRIARFARVELFRNTYEYRVFLLRVLGNAASYLE